MVESDPGMPCLLPYRPHRLGERRVGKSSNSYADAIRKPVREPIYGRAASRTKVKADFSSLPSIANIGSARAIRADIPFPKVSGYAKRCASAPLTFDAMTGANEDRIGNRFSLERSAATACDSSHRMPLSAECHRQDDPIPQNSTPRPLIGHDDQPNHHSLSPIPSRTRARWLSSNSFAIGQEHHAQRTTRTGNARAVPNCLSPPVSTKRWAQCRNGTLCCSTSRERLCHRRCTSR
jgi:hypothetical protein